MFELWHGRKKGEVINELLSSLKTLNLDSAASRKAGDILRVLQAEGNILDLKDLFIGAICIAQGAKLVTFNKKHFQKLGKFGLEIMLRVICNAFSLIWQNLTTLNHTSGALKQLSGRAFQSKRQKAFMFLGKRHWI